MTNNYSSMHLAKGLITSLHKDEKNVFFCDNLNIKFFKGSGNLYTHRLGIAIWSQEMESLKSQPQIENDWTSLGKSELSIVAIIKGNLYPKKKETGTGFRSLGRRRQFGDHTTSYTKGRNL